MDVFLGGKFLLPLFQTLGHHWVGSLPWRNPPGKLPGWLCGEFRDELYAEKVPMASLAFRSHIWDSQDPTGRVPRNQEKNMEKL